MILDLAIGCKCSSLKNHESGEGNCKNYAEGGLWCYVIEPSNCTDLIDSTFYSGMRWSRRNACKNRKSNSITYKF